MDLSALAEALPPLDQGDVTLIVCESPDGLAEKLLRTERGNGLGSGRDQAGDDSFREAPRGTGGHTTNFRAHRSVLLSASVYFKSLFSNFKEATQETVTVYWDANIFAKVLSFLYGKTLHIEPSDILPLIQVSTFIPWFHPFNESAIATRDCSTALNFPKSLCIS